ncbi:MAG: hypothetical protein HKN16_06860 [Saprospiraceae bacterium]|nr:hypothetical protein [Saprospiraceae bacterium]
MRIINRILLGFGILLFIGALLVFRPVPIVKEEKALTKLGTVERIYEGGVKDVVFRLEGDPTRYYINRGLENDLNLETLRADLLGKNVTIKYPKYWTPLDPKNCIRHLSKLEFEGRVIFNELK